MRIIFFKRIQGTNIKHNILICRSLHQAGIKYSVLFCESDWSSKSYVGLVLWI